MGRPLKNPSEGRRHNVMFRLTETMRDRVAATAEASGRSMSEELERIVEAHFAAADTRQTIRDEIRDEIRAVFAERDEADRLMAALIGPVRAHDDRAADLDTPLLGLPGPPLNG